MKKFLMVFFMVSFLFSCTTKTAMQTEKDKSFLKAPLIQGEYVIRANSCSLVPEADFMAGGKAVFGSCYLTNLRFIYEESEWARTLAALAKAVPVNQDFGVQHLIKGATEVFNANYVIGLGMDGKLGIVKRTGQIIIPLSEIEKTSISGSRFSTSDADCLEKMRWISIKGGYDQIFVFEIYDLPPDKTKMMPRFDNHNWEKIIEKTEKDFFAQKAFKPR
ncbi:MAG: hypothetical protein RBR08_14730 [Desulforegulaceae bacterium]|nr:hypothetical protein [Desulforegulaceae bacterium]